MGLTPTVVDQALVEPAWGNELRDRSRQVFASVAERDSQWPAPPNGAACITLDTGTTWYRVAGAWVASYPPLGFVTSWNGPGSQDTNIPFAGGPYNRGGWTMGQTITVPAGAAGIYQWTLDVALSTVGTASPNFATVNIGGIGHAQGFVPGAAALTMAGTTNVAAASAIYAQVHMGTGQTMTVRLAALRAAPV